MEIKTSVNIERVKNTGIGMMGNPPPPQTHSDVINEDKWTVCDGGHWSKTGM